MSPVNTQAYVPHVDQKQLLKYEAEIAVLQVEFKNLDSKFDESLTDLKEDNKEVLKKIEKHTDTTQVMLREFQAINVAQHNDMANKIAGLEKWRWMLIGAGMVLGTLVYPSVESFLRA